MIILPSFKKDREKSRTKIPIGAWRGHFKKEHNNFHLMSKYEIKTIQNIYWSAEEHTKFLEALRRWL